MNEYFERHPEMVLGTVEVGHGMYSFDTVKVNAGDRDLVPDLRGALAQVAAQARRADAVHAPRGISADERRAAAVVGGSPAHFPGHISLSPDGEFRRRTVYGTDEPLAVPSSQQRELRGLLGIRDATVALLEAEAVSAQDNESIGDLRSVLNARYDAYVDRYGPINRCSWHPSGRLDADTGEPVLSVRRPPVMRTFREDPHQPAVMALEDYDATTDTASKMAIMSRRVVAPRTPRLGADTPADALAICMDTHGRIDVDVVAQLLGVEEDTAREQLRGLVFADPEQGGALVSAAEYLSGDVRAKLSAAEAALVERPQA